MEQLTAAIDGLAPFGAHQPVREVRARLVGERRTGEYDLMERHVAAHGRGHLAVPHLARRIEEREELRRHAGILAALAGKQHRQLAVGRLLRKIDPALNEERRIPCPTPARPRLVRVSRPGPFRRTQPRSSGRAAPSCLASAIHARDAAARLAPPRPASAGISRRALRDRPRRARRARRRRDAGASIARASRGTPRARRGSSCRRTRTS